MSENKKREYKNTGSHTEKIEFDEMKIRLHLNDSLDLSGISVSEDLIHRTLLAIEKQPNLQEAPDQKVISRSVVPWSRYFRALAGVAAAVVVVAVGYGFASNGGFIGHKSFSSNEMAYDTSASPEEATSGSMATEGSGDMSLFQAKGDGDAGTGSVTQNDAGAGFTTDSTYGDEAGNPENSQHFDGLNNGGGTNGDNQETGEIEDSHTESPKYSVVAEVPAALGSVGAGGTGSSSGSGGSVGSAAPEKSSLPAVQSRMNKSQEAQETALSFRDIFQADPAKASSLTVTDEVNKVSVVLTGKEDILSFYTLMEQHQFTNGGQSVDTSGYTIEIVTPSPSMTRYTMYIGDVIAVDYADAVTTSHSTYKAGDPEKLSTDIREFYQKHRD